MPVIFDIFLLFPSVMSVSLSSGRSKRMSDVTGSMLNLVLAETIKLTLALKTV